MNVGQRIRQFRKEKKLTLKQLSSSCNLSHSYLSLVERDERQISIKNLFDICNVLNISLAEFFCEGKQVVIEQNEIPSILMPFFISAMSLDKDKLIQLASLTPDQLQQIIALLEVVKQKGDK